MGRSAASAHQACYVSENSAGMLRFASRGGKQNHPTDGSEFQAVYLHVCSAEQIHTETVSSLVELFVTQLWLQMGKSSCLDTSRK